MPRSVSNGERQRRMKQGRQFEVNDKVLKCLVCGSENFSHRKVQLNTSLLTFMNLDWLNKRANCFTCDDCGFIHWFAPKR